MLLMCNVVNMTRLGGHKQGNTLNLLLGACGDDVHVYTILNLSKMVFEYRSAECGEFFHSAINLKKHKSDFACLSRYIYPGGIYKRYKSLWKELVNEGVDYIDVFSEDDKRRWITYALGT